MRESGVKEAEFFWLGRVPCRSVKIVGLLVGVQAYETRIVYHVDDGTAVIECHHRSPALNKPKETKSESALLEPMANVGCSVTVTGRISPWHETRRIHIDSIVRCPSANDEPKHWINVRALHKTHYSLEEPFIIPLRPASQLPTHTNAAQVPATPSAASSTPSSPFKSPTKSDASHASPHKLRHPSRLHTNDLTGNAFRIYVKHYMDNADDFLPVAPEPSTPTKSSHNKLPPADETPRPHDRTPKRVPALDFTRTFVSDDPTRGFTLSYLRRVPELSLMAKRVVKAEAKRRARDARKKAKEGGSSQKPAVVTKIMLDDKQKLHPRMKRLFQVAILQLVKDGDVIPWEGPVRPCLPSGDTPGPDTSGLWKMNSSVATVGGNSTMFSSASIAEDDEDEGELTDPADEEEAFVPLSPTLLATTVEKAITTLISRATERAHARTDPNRPRVRVPAAGPTVDEIVSFLKKDDLWRNLSDFTVKEALSLLQDEGRAWTIGGDRWELTL
ncbi:hypothetical protein C8R44DRAFT_873728 [Mycena epipterygia]|nr:hypothetical protein C8R44DRAFT_873728 [Mycena epipterygia]